jgi:hypothetical protein
MTENEMTLAQFRDHFEHILAKRGDLYDASDKFLNEMFSRVQDMDITNDVLVVSNLLRDEITYRARIAGGQW